MNILPKIWGIIGIFTVALIVWVGYFWALYRAEKGDIRFRWMRYAFEPDIPNPIFADTPDEQEQLCEQRARLSWTAIQRLAGKCDKIRHGGKRTIADYEDTAKSLQKFRSYLVNIAKKGQQQCEVYIRYGQPSAKAFMFRQAFSQVRHICENCSAETECVLQMYLCDIELLNIDVITGDIFARNINEINNPVETKEK